MINNFSRKKISKKPTEKKFALSAFAIVLCFLMLGCSAKPANVSSTHFLMDTIVNIDAFGSDEQAVNSAVNETFSYMQEVSDQFDRYSKNSSMTKINENAGKSAVETTDDIVFIVDFLQKQQYNQVDVTIGPLIDLWNSKKEQNKIPDVDDIVNIQSFIGLDKLVLDSNKKSIFLTKANMSLDFGAIAKGYVIEKASQKLAENKAVSYALINGGGNIKTIGQKPDKKPWRIGVQDPRDKSKLLGVLNLSKGKAVATSGDYQRFFEVDGKRYHHILDVKTGYPSQENISVTVICDDAFIADYYSTLLFVLPLDEAFALAKKQAVKIIVVHKDNKIYLSADLKGIFEKNEQSSWQYVQK